MLSAEEVISFSAPGKAILSGEHSVVYGKNALVMAINLRTTCTMQWVNLDGEDQDRYAIILENPSETDTRLMIGRVECEEVVRKVSEQKLTDFSQLIELFPNVQEKLLMKVFLLCIVTLQLLEDDFSLLLPCWKNNLLARTLLINVTSTLPISKGLGSSASYFSSLAASALSLVSRFEECKKQTAEVDSLEFLETANKLTLKLERIYHGNPSGIDNYIAIYGGLLVFNKTTGGRALNVRGRALPYRIVLIDTQVEKSTKRAVERVREIHDDASLAGIGKRAIDMIADVTEELINVLEAATVEEDFDKAKFENLVKFNHCLLRMFDLSHPAIEKLMAVCMNHGIPSKITGAGQGGNCIAFIPTHLSEDQQALFAEDIAKAGFILIDANLSADGLRREK